MIKTLERHHSEFYRRPGAVTSFFPHNPSVEDIFQIAQQVLNQNTSEIRELLPTGSWPALRAFIDGVEYRVGVTNGRVVTVFPEDQPGICTI